MQLARLTAQDKLDLSRQKMQVQNRWLEGALQGEAKPKTNLRRFANCIWFVFDLRPGREGGSR